MTRKSKPAVSHKRKAISVPQMIREIHRITSGGAAKELFAVNSKLEASENALAQMHMACEQQEARAKQAELRLVTANREREEANAKLGAVTLEHDRMAGQLLTAKHLLARYQQLHGVLPAVIEDGG